MFCAFAILVLGFTACTHTEEKSKGERAESDAFKNRNQTSLLLPLYREDTTLTGRFPDDSIFTHRVLTTGVFHNREVDESAEEIEWYGLFHSMEGYYLKKTEITIKSVKDESGDLADEKTGWEVSTDQEDSCLILIENISILRERHVVEAALPEIIYPGDTVEFEYLEMVYKLVATGEKKLLQENPDWYEVWNYKLYLISNINGEAKESLLVSIPNFDDTMVKIIFGGDIDGDEILDLIIDTSDNYLEISPTLYLSKPAVGKEILRPVGKHSSADC